jgi:hypothetical protein
VVGSRFAGWAFVAAALGGGLAFLSLALAGEPLLGLLVGLPFAGMVLAVWRLVLPAWRLRQRWLRGVPPAKHRPFRRDPWKDIDKGR